MNLHDYSSSPIWRRVKPLGTCVWWTCTLSVACPLMHVVSSIPSSEPKLLWVQPKIFPTGNQKFCIAALNSLHPSYIHVTSYRCTFWWFLSSRRSNLPWLYYGDEPGLALRVLQTEPVPIRFSFRGNNKVSEGLEWSLSSHNIKKTEIASQITGSSDPLKYSGKWFKNDLIIVLVCPVYLTEHWH